VRALHLVAGLGGSRRATARAADDVVVAARANGWQPTVVSLDAVGRALAERPDGMERLVLCGGDGLVHRAAQLAAGRAVDVAVVPVGSGNDFARAFGIGAAAVETAAAPPGQATVRAVDLLRVGDRYAASVLTGGYSGRVNATANRLRFPPGSAKYTVAALAEIGRLAPRPVRLDAELPDGSTQVLEAPMTFFAIGNTAWFGGGMQVCPTADPADGLVDVVTVGRLGRLEFVRWLPKVFRGAHLGHPAVGTTRARAVTVTTAESLWADGEQVAPAATPVTVSVAPGALRLLVPEAGRLAVSEGRAAFG